MATDEHLFPPEPTPRRRVPAGQAALTILIALLVGLLLNADRIDRTAHSQPFGWQRTWAVRLTGPIKAVADATRLNKPRELLADAAGNELGPPPEDASSVSTVPPAAADAPTTTTQPVSYRQPTAAEPLRVLVIGDSLMGWIGPAIAAELDGDPIDVEQDWQVGSGLARPDVINWPARAADDVASKQPDVVVVGFGGNDAQDMSTDDGRVVVGTQAWAAEYQRRVAQILNAIEAPGRTVYWVGLPITTRANIEAAAPAMARAVETEVSARPWAHYIDTRPLLAGADGQYATYLPDASGKDVKVREDDGVHPNLAGAKRMVAPLVEALIDERKLGETAATTTTTTTTATTSGPTTTSAPG